MRRLYALIFVVCLLSSSCAGPPNDDDILELPISTPVFEDIPQPSPTPASTPADTSALAVTLPESSPTPSPSAATPTPENTPAPTPTPAPENTPAPTPAEDRVTVAEGFSYMRLDDGLKARITGMSYPDDGKDLVVTYDDLRYIRLKYYDFDGSVHDGELIVHRKLAKEVTQIFHELYLAKYPFASIRLVDDFGEPGDDNLSMAANNTSAFNYRRVTGSKTLSLHSYGAAIDINPLYNPYITGRGVSPPGGEAYADRAKDFPGKIDKNDLCYRIFTDRGWSWGGDFKSDKDYQHFSKKV